MENSEKQQEMVTVGRFLDPAEGQFALGALEAAGIDGFLVGETANSMVPMAFRTRLQVRREDEAAAKELLGAADSDELGEAAEASELEGEQGV